MKHLNELLALCIELDAIFEVQNGRVKVIKFDGEWFPNKQPVLWASCETDNTEAIEEIKFKLISLEN